MEGAGVGCRSFVFLDDDPTGVQTLAGIRVLLAWDAATIRETLRGRGAVHLITNARALPPERVQPLIEDAARAARTAVPDTHVVLRGDSTLRGHLREEYLGVRAATAPRTWPALLLVPALPSAGRITVGGIHFFQRGDHRIPLHETEYAHDGLFAYGSARLLEWAEERSQGLFRASAGRELHLDDLRSGGSAAVADALLALGADGAPAVLAPDAETVTDLELVAAGYESAVRGGVAAIVRCAPTLAGVLAGTTATAAAPLPEAGHGVLVVCGSYVPQTTRQLMRLVAGRPQALVEADVAALAGSAPAAEIARLAARVATVLARDGIAVLATPRARPDGTASLEAGERVAVNLARVVGRMSTRPSVLLAKGGITSAVTLRDGVGASEADVLGPVTPGVSRWAAFWPDGRPLDYLVVPGNVGDDDLLVDLVDGIMRGSASC